MIRRVPALKRQFFLTFTVYGSVLPYLSVVLAQRGLSMTQIGQVLSLTGVAVMVSPVFTTLLADTRVQSRTLLGLLFAASGLSLGWLAGVEGFTLILLTHGLFALAYAPMNALQDGLYFHRRAELEALPTEVDAPAVSPYHFVRVFGTLGFIAPSVVLYLLLRDRSDATAALWCGAVCAGVGALNAVTLPRQARQAAALNDGDRRKLPTLAAAQALFRGRLLVFCGAMLLLNVAVAAYYAFFPVYLTRELGVADEWVGLITTLGVIVEIGFMLGFGRLVARVGLRGLLVLGTLTMVLRFGLLAAWPSVGVAVATQVLHGIMVLVIHVAPPLVLDRRADPAYRSSMQGLFAMTVYGVGRIAGNLLSGVVAEVSLTAVFTFAAALSLVGAGLFMYAFEKRASDV
jgi:PPP family 3-phenylpropionic acid transporter